MHGIDSLLVESGGFIKKNFDTFSVPLGLLDYVNPILYTVTMVTILCNEYALMEGPYNTLLLVGAIISILFGLIIPTGKVLVGLEVIEFVMPVSLVFCVNTGILMSGLMLFGHVMGLGAIAVGALALLIACLLILVFRKSRKVNTIAVLTGAAGYLLLYVSLITLSALKARLQPIVLYALAIILFVMLCGIGIKGNLKDPKVHWVIEASNVMCQLLVAVATVLLYVRDSSRKLTCDFDTAWSKRPVETSGHPGRSGASVCATPCQS